MQSEFDKNLMVVSAVEGYAFNHNVSTKEACYLFEKYNIMKLIRSQYDALHTQDLSETITFAEEIMARRIQHEK